MRMYTNILNMGRVLIPVEIRKIKNLHSNDKVSIFINERNNIEIEKVYSDSNYDFEDGIKTIKRMYLSSMTNDDIVLEVAKVLEKYKV